MTSKKKSALGLLPLFLLLLFASDEIKVSINLEEQGTDFKVELKTDLDSPNKQNFSGQLDRIVLSEDSVESVRSSEGEENRSRDAASYQTSKRIAEEELSRIYAKNLEEPKNSNVQLPKKDLNDDSNETALSEVDYSRSHFTTSFETKKIKGEAASRKHTKNLEERKDSNVQLAKNLFADDSNKTARSFKIIYSRSHSTTSFKNSDMMKAEKYSLQHTQNLEKLKQKQSKPCACVQKCANSKCVACVRKWAKNSKRFNRVVGLLGYTYTMLKYLLKVTVDYTLAAGEMVVDLTALFIGAGLTIFVETNWKGMLQKLALKVETFYKKDLKYKLKVVFAGALFALLFGSFYLYAWGDVQEYISQLKNPIHLKDRTETLKSFALVTFLHILKVPITAIMPLFAGAFGVLTSIMFPLSAVFVSTFASGVGLGFWYLMYYLTKFDVIGLIGDNTACGLLEYLIPHEWHKEEGGMTQTQFEDKKAAHIHEHGEKLGLKMFREEIARPVTYKGENGEASAYAKAAILCLSMIYFRIFFPGIGDSLINTYVIRYGVGFPEVFISLWLGLPENAFMSYALQVIKHPWISALLMIFLGGLATTTWIGKYIYRRKYKPEEFEKHGYHAKKYDLYKKLLDLLIFLGVFFLTFNIRNILPVDVFQLDAYYTNKTAANCTMSGEYDDIYTSYGEVCNPATVSRNMGMAWGFGFTGYVTILALLQTARNSIPCFKNKNFNKADDFSVKCKLASFNGMKNKLSDDLDLIQGRFKLNKSKSDEYIQMKLNEIVGVQELAKVQKHAAKIAKSHENDENLKKIYAENEEEFENIVTNAKELNNEVEPGLVDENKLTKI